MLRVQPITAADAHTVSTWRYPPPYDIYNLDTDDQVELLDPANQYHAVLDQDDLVAILCLGHEAQVPGGDYTDTTVTDVGFLFSPDLTGSTRAGPILEAILHHASTRSGTSRLRTTVAAWNEWELKRCADAGFRAGQRFASDGHAPGEYVQMFGTRPSTTDGPDGPA